MIDRFRRIFGPPICIGTAATQIPILIKDPTLALAWFALFFAFTMGIVVSQKHEIEE